MFRVKTRGNSNQQRSFVPHRGAQVPKRTNTTRDRSETIPTATALQKKTSPTFAATSGGPQERQTLAEYDRRMSKFENLQDIAFLPDMRIVVRLDAHRLGLHWSSFPDAEYPLGATFSAGMRAAAAAIFTSGIRVLFTFVHGDEISVALDPQELANGRKKARLISGLASAASVGLCTALGRGALFHAKVSELPTLDHLVEYLIWQRLVARRNTIARHLTLALTAQGVPKGELDRLLTKATEEERLASLAKSGIHFELLPPSERLGALLWWSPSPVPSSLRIEGQPYGIAECLDLPADEVFEDAMRIIAQGVTLSTEAEAPIFPRSVPLPGDRPATIEVEESEDCDEAD